MHVRNQDPAISIADRVKNLEMELEAAQHEIAVMSDALREAEADRMAAEERVSVLEDELLKNDLESPDGKDLFDDFDANPFDDFDDDTPGDIDLISDEDERPL